MVWFGAAVALWATAFTFADAAAADRAAWLDLAGQIAKFAVLAAIAVGVLRMEGVRPAELGLSRRHLRTGVAAFAGVWVAINLVGAGVAAVAGNEWGAGLILQPPASAGEQVETFPAPWVVLVAIQFLVVGAVEEFVLRGYFQTKVIALLGDGTRFRIALGVVTASAAFGVLHTPGALLATGSLETALGAAALPALTGIFFGAFYELTRNVYFVAALHGLGNTWPLVVDWSGWSGTPLVAFFAGVAVVYVGATLAYRSWALDTDLTPAIRRVDASRRSTGT